MHASRDPAEEVRSALAQLTARARQLAHGGESTTAATAAAAAAAVSDAALHMQRDSHSLYEASRRLSQAVTQQQQQQQQQLTTAPRIDNNSNNNATAAATAAYDGSPSIELFMARQLGFDAQEQQRLLQQLQRRQTLAAADVATGTATTHMAASASDVRDGMTGTAYASALRASALASEEDDVTAMVAHAKAALQRRGRAALHAQLERQLRARGDALCRAAWTPYVARLQGDLVAAHVRSCADDAAAAAASLSSQQQQRQQHVMSPYAHDVDDGSGAPSTLWPFAHDGSVAAAALRARAVAFARIVDAYAPPQWAAQCAAYVHEQQDMLLRQERQQATSAAATREGGVTALWSSVASMLSLATRAAGASLDVVTCAHVSRLDLETRALRKLQRRAARRASNRNDNNYDDNNDGDGNGSSGALDASSRWSAAHVFDALVDEAAATLDTTTTTTSTRRRATTQRCGVSAWQHVFAAMRVGRYDAAALAAQSVGSHAVSAALERLASTSALPRCRASPALELQALYHEHNDDDAPRSDADGSAGCRGGSAHDARGDVYRQAVLFVLLVGVTGESDEAVARTLLMLCGRVAHSLEDALWLRLTCVRCDSDNDNDRSSSSSHVPRVQCLSHLQRVVLDDMASIVTLAQGDVVRLAHFLLHAMLPSTALRLLLDDSRTSIDGLHMAMCLAAGHVLTMQTRSTHTTTDTTTRASNTSNGNDDSSRDHAHTMRDNDNDQRGKAAGVLLDSPLNLTREVARYGVRVLLPLTHGTPSTRVPLRAVYAYFYKTHSVRALVEACLQSDALCTRLFGQRGTQLQALVTQPSHTGTITTAAASNNIDDTMATDDDVVVTSEVLACMRAVAQQAAARGRAVVAAQANLAIVTATQRDKAQRTRSAAVETRAADRTATAALRRAVRVLTPALAQAFHHAASSCYVADVFALAADVYNLLAQGVVSLQRASVTAVDMATRTRHTRNNDDDDDDDGDTDMSDTDDDDRTTQQLQNMYETMCALARVYTAAARNDYNEVTQLFFAMPFVPTNDNNMVTAYSSLPDDLAVALRAIVPVVLQAAATRLQECMQYTRQYMQDNNMAAVNSSSVRDINDEVLMTKVRTSALCNWIATDTRAVHEPANDTLLEAIHAYKQQYLHNVL